jgi:hypothetical protein
MYASGRATRVQWDITIVALNRVATINRILYLPRKVRKYRINAAVERSDWARNVIEIALFIFELAGRFDCSGCSDKVLPDICRQVVIVRTHDHT